MSSCSRVGVWGGCMEWEGAKLTVGWVMWGTEGMWGRCGLGRWAGLGWRFWFGVGKDRCWGWMSWLDKRWDGEGTWGECVVGMWWVLYVWQVEGGLVLVLGSGWVLRRMGE
jgi:hypothetical protein